MISWIIILFGLATSYYYVDLNSSYSIHSVWAPLCFVIFSMAFCLKLVLNFKWARSRCDSGATGGSSIFGEGGDGGC